MHASNAFLALYYIKVIHFNGQLYFFQFNINHTHFVSLRGAFTDLQIYIFFHKIDWILASISNAPFYSLLWNGWETISKWLSNVLTNKSSFKNGFFSEKIWIFPLVHIALGLQWKHALIVCQINEILLDWKDYYGTKIKFSMINAIPTNGWGLK